MRSSATGAGQPLSAPPPVNAAMHRALGRLLRFALPYWPRLLTVTLALVGAGAAAIAMPKLLGWAIDTGLGVTVGQGRTAVAVDETLLIVAGLALLGAAGLRGGFQFVQSYLSECVAQAVAYDLRNSLYRRLQSLSFAYHDAAETGQILSRATQDVEVVRMFFNFGALRLIYAAALTTVVLGLMLTTHWQLGLVVAGFMALIAWRSFVVARRLRPVWAAEREDQARLGTVLQESLSGIRVVKAFSREPFESRKFAQVARQLFIHSLLAARIQAVNSPIMNALWVGSLVAIVWLGGVEVVHGDLSIGTLSAFLLYVTLLQMPLRSLGWMVTMVPRAATAAARIFELLDQESAVREAPDALPLLCPRGLIRFDHVSFAYADRSPVLHDVSFQARPGELVALVGPTGSGKSSIVNLIPRFYDLTNGAITFDGLDLRSLQLDSLRRQVAVVQQDVFLFSDTIRNNIAYGRPDATQEEVEAAATIARMHDFIRGLPQGYHTWVGERGVTLSGGQKQRIAIARALLMDPRVLIFDDSTASVDTKTEAEIQRALARLREGRTTFVIAHRLRTLQGADQILVLEEGRIVERGRHAELLARPGHYRRIYELELRDQAEAFALPLSVAGAGGSA